MIPKFTWEGEEQTLVTKARGLARPDIMVLGAWPLWGCRGGAVEQTSASCSRLISHGHSIYEKGASVQWGEDSHFNNILGQRHVHMGKYILHPYFQLRQKSIPGGLWTYM